MQPTPTIAVGSDSKGILLHAGDGISLSVVVALSPERALRLAEELREAAAKAEAKSNSARSTA